MAGNQEKWVCDLCNTTSDSLGQLFDHASSRHSVTISDGVKCSVCLQLYSSVFTFVQHFKATHTRKIHRCEICGRNTESALANAIHQTVHR